MPKIINNVITTGGYSFTYSSDTHLITQLAGDNVRITRISDGIHEIFSVPLAVFVDANDNVITAVFADFVAYMNQSTAIDALTLTNFQAAMLANQVPDAGVELPTITGVVFSALAARTTDALTPHTAITNNLSTILTVDNTAPEGTHLLVSLSVTSSGLVSPSILSGFFIQEGAITTPVAFANNDYLIVENGGANRMIDTVVTLDIYIYGGDMLVKCTSPSFFSASLSGRYDGVTVATYPLTATPTEITSFSCDAAAGVNSATTLAFTEVNVIEL